MRLPAPFNDDDQTRYLATFRGHTWEKPTVEMKNKAAAVRAVAAAYGVSCEQVRRDWERCEAALARGFYMPAIPSRCVGKSYVQQNPQISLRGQPWPKKPATTSHKVTVNLADDVDLDMAPGAITRIAETLKIGIEQVADDMVFRMLGGNQSVDR